jgi:hypothetical protein
MHVIPRILDYTEINFKIVYSLLPIMRRGLKFQSCAPEAEENLPPEYLMLE